MNYKKINMILSLSFVFLVLILAYLVLSTSPRQISPLSGMVISEEFSFEFENADKVLISTDKNFTNPIVLEIDSKIDLPPGIYFWKIKGMLRKSEIKNFTIQSRVSLDLKERNQSFILINSGNVDVNVTKGNVTGEDYFVLEIRDVKELEKQNFSLEGRQE